MSKHSFDKNEVMCGVETLKILEELDRAYDSFIQLSYHGTEQEVDEHKEYIEDVVSELEEGSQESPYDNLMDNLDTAFNSAVLFNRASGEERLEIKEENEEAYQILVQSRPSKVSLDEPRLLERFKPNSGSHYNLTRRVIHEGADSLDAWIEKIEEQQENQEPATTPGDREDTAENMYQ